MTTANLLLANLVLDASNIRESSYDKASADAATAEVAQHDPLGFIDYTKFYTKTLMQAATEACETAGLASTQMAMPVYLLLFCAWNDAIEWASQVRGDAETSHAVEEAMTVTKALTAEDLAIRLIEYGKTPLLGVDETGGVSNVFSLQEAWDLTTTPKKLLNVALFVYPQSCATEEIQGRI